MIIIDVLRWRVGRYTVFLAIRQDTELNWIEQVIMDGDRIKVQSNRERRPVRSYEVLPKKGTEILLKIRVSNIQSKNLSYTRCTLMMDGGIYAASKHTHKNGDESYFVKCESLNF